MANEFFFDYLFEIFLENEIDKLVMSKLSPEIIKELIPKIGPRIRFMTKWKNHFGLSSIESDTRSPSRSTRSSITSREGSSNISMNDYDSNSENDSETDKENHDFHMTRQDCFNSTKTFEQLRLFSVKNILQKSIQGAAILKSYKKTKQLTRTTRNIVVDLLISEITNSKFPMKNADFERLARKIVEVFPSENCNIYYVPAVKKRDSRNNRSVTSRGKLVDKYRNRVQAYKKLALLDRNFADTRQEDLEDAADMDLDTELRESITWLNKNQAPWEVVLSHWKNTSMIRRKEIENSNTKSIAAVYTKWPILNHPQGYTLIDADFSSLGLTGITNDLPTWNTFFNQIKAMNQLNTKDSNAIALHELLELTDINDDTKVAVQLLLLPHMIPPRGRIRVNKKHWKPSISECKDSIIMHATIAGDVAVVQERRINAMKNLSLPLQPFIIVVGSDITRISATYVSVDQILYNVPSTIAALDICFKVFHIFHAAYPPESEHLWYILQIALYRVKTKWDKHIPYVAEIISHFERQKDSID